MASQASFSPYPSSSSLPSSASTVHVFVRHLDGFSIPHPPFPSVRSLLDAPGVAAVNLVRLISAVLRQHRQRQQRRARAKQSGVQDESEEEVEEEEEEWEEDGAAAEDGGGVESGVLKGRLQSAVNSLQRLLGVDLSYLAAAAVVRGEEEQVLCALQVTDAAIQSLVPPSLHDDTHNPSSHPSLLRLTAPSSPPLSFRRVALDAASPASVLLALDEVERFLRIATASIASSRTHNAAAGTRSARTSAVSPNHARGPPPRPAPVSAHPSSSPPSSRRAASLKVAGVTASKGSSGQRSPSATRAQTAKAERRRRVERVAQRAVEEVEDELELDSEAQLGGADIRRASPVLNAANEGSDDSSAGAESVAFLRSRLLPLARQLRDSTSRRVLPFSSASASAADSEVGSRGRHGPAIFSSSAASRPSRLSHLSAQHRRHSSARLRTLRAALLAEEEEEKRLRRERETDLEAEERRRELERKRVEADAVERCLRVAMGRGRREEREIERAVDEQARRVQAMMDSRREALQLYYQQQVQCVQEKMQRDEEERRIQRKVTRTTPHRTRSSPLTVPTRPRARPLISARPVSARVRLCARAQEALRVERASARERQRRSNGHVQVETRAPRSLARNHLLFDSSASLTRALHAHGPVLCCCAQRWREKFAASQRRHRQHAADMEPG